MWEQQKEHWRDQWKEFFYCDAMDKSVMVKKGQKRTGVRSSNVHGNDNIISNGSGIAVADGQCMIIVEQGKVVEVCAEPGQFTYDTSTEPSIFSGNLGDSIKASFATVGKRFTFGGDTGKDQRIYYFNTKELIDNKFGTPNPIPFRVVDSKIGLDIDVSVRCSGVYSYRISNPLLFYTNVCGNVENEYTRDELDRQLKTEFISALQPAFGRLSELELRPNQIVTHNTDLEDAMNETLSAKWGELRGLKVVSIALGSVTLPDEDAEVIKQAQRTAMLQNPTMAAATMVGAQADAMKAAAANESGAMNGFIGMGMAMKAGGWHECAESVCNGGPAGGSKTSGRNATSGRSKTAGGSKTSGRSKTSGGYEAADGCCTGSAAECRQLDMAAAVMLRPANSVRNVVRRDRRSRQAGFALWCTQ